ncbi:MAG: hypothetical protein QNJ41_11480 [Xenococcaceae cyanobacterium MO_188.B32]|nr:hypothetical protein [Xenococcaceae cyanobacterium MO_188.B32]
MKPKFSTLIIITLISAAILTPFVFSSYYIPILRENNFKILLFLQDDLYKLITGYIALAFVIFEMILTARKRGRGWIIKLSIPGSMQLWRSLHIFLGVGLLAIILIHTLGATGLNFNSIFLWVFFGVSLSALVGVVAETGIVESPQKLFLTWLPNQNYSNKKMPGVAKGTLIRNLRSIWLTSHIILVSIFFVMLGFHIFLAYYYQ